MFGSEADVHHVRHKELMMCECCGSSWKRSWCGCVHGGKATTSAQPLPSFGPWAHHNVRRDRIPNSCDLCDGNSCDLCVHPLDGCVLLEQVQVHSPDLCVRFSMTSTNRHTHKQDNYNNVRQGQHVTISVQRRKKNRTVVRAAQPNTKKTNAVSTHKKQHTTQQGVNQ